MNWTEFIQIFCLEWLWKVYPFQQPRSFTTELYREIWWWIRSLRDQRSHVFLINREKAFFAVLTLCFWNDGRRCHKRLRRSMINEDRVSLISSTSSVCLLTSETRRSSEVALWCLRISSSSSNDKVGSTMLTFTRRRLQVLQAWDLPATPTIFANESILVLSGSRRLPHQKRARAQYLLSEPTQISLKWSANDYRDRNGQMTKY